MNALVSPGRKLVIGHRGCAACAPENTAEGIRLALDRGADAVEFDVRLTSDGEVVLFHDPTVDRTTGAVGAVHRMSLAQLQELDLGARFRPASPNAAPRAARYTVARLDDILAEFANANLLIEVKVPEVSPHVRAIIERHGAEKRCVVDSYDAGGLDAFRGSAIPVGAGRNGVVRAMLREALGLTNAGDPAGAYCVPPRFMGIPLSITTLLRAANQTGSVVHVWTVNDASQAADLWKQGVSGIITDDVVPILRARETVALA